MIKRYDPYHNQATYSAHPFVVHLIGVLRNKNTESQLFRRTMKQLAPLLAFEALADLPTKEAKIDTELANDIIVKTLADSSVTTVQILGAGAGYDRAVDLLDDIDGLDLQCGYIAMSRDHETLKPTLHYDRVPEEIVSDITIVFEPMCATGGSLSDAVSELKQRGAKNIICVCLLAAVEGLEHMCEEHPDIKIHVGDIDPELNKNGYIVPGLGDAGDRYLGC